MLSLWEKSSNNIKTFIKNCKINISKLSEIEKEIINNEYFEEFFSNEKESIKDLLEITIKKYTDCKFNKKYKFNILDEKGEIIKDYDILENGMCVPKKLFDEVLEELDKYSKDEILNVDITEEIIKTIPKDKTSTFIKFTISKILKKYFGSINKLLLYSLFLIFILNKNTVVANSNINFNSLTSKIESIYNNKTNIEKSLIDEKIKKAHFNEKSLYDFKKIKEIEDKLQELLKNIKKEKKETLLLINKLFPKFETKREFAFFKRQSFLKNVEIFKNKIGINLLLYNFDINDFTYEKYLSNIDNLINFITNKYDYEINQNYNRYNFQIESLEKKSFSLIKEIEIEYDKKINDINNRNNKLLYDLLKLTNMENADKYLKNIIDSYYELEYLGGGISGKAYKSIDLNTNEIVIIKKLRNNEIVEEEINNLEYIRDFCGDYFTCLIDIKKDEEFTYIITKYDEDFLSLDKVISIIKNDSRLFYNIIDDIISALKTLHYTGMVHHDIKLENIIANINTGKIKLIDFTSSCTSAENCSKSIIADFKYIYPPLAKEIIKNEEGLNFEYSEKADMFSLGCVIYKIIIGQTPVEANYKIYKSYNNFYNDYEFINDKDINYNKVMEFLEKVSLETNTPIIDIGSFLNVK